MKSYKYLIIGGGMTADAAVKGIRKVDKGGTIGIIGAEPDPPYKRPPLSKGLWNKDMSLDDIWCNTESNSVELTRSTTAASIDPGKQEVRDEQGQDYHYDRLLLATGATPKHLPFGNDHLIYYRTCQDYRRLRTIMEGGGHIAVLGGSFIGSEIAAALAGQDAKVTMVFPESDLCGRLLPGAFAHRITEYYEERGVTILTGRKPSAIDVDGDIVTVHLENGHAFSVDAVVAGLGVVPNTQLAEDAGLAVNDGIVVDEYLCTKDPNIFAAGDVASFYNPQLDQRLRVEHEDNALAMGAMAGRNMAGEKEPYHHLPYFYSDLFDVGYEAIGETNPSLEVISDLEDIQEKGCIFYMRDQRVRGVVLWNIFGKVAAARELIAAPGPHTANGLRVWSKERFHGDKA